MHPVLFLMSLLPSIDIWLKAGGRARMRKNWRSLFGRFVGAADRSPADSKRARKARQESR